MIKKLIAFSIAGAMLWLSPAAGAAIAENQLTIWVHSDKGYDGIARVGERYTKDTGVKVTVAHPDQVEVRFQQDAAAGNGPDIFLWAHDRFGELVRSGLLAPVEPSDGEKAKFADFAWDAMTVGGKIYGYPVSIEAIGLVCNRKLVPDAPDNWEDFIELDDELQKQGAHAILWDYTTPYYSYPLISAKGGYAFRKEADGSYDVSDTGIANQGAKDGLRFLVDLITARHLKYGADYSSMEQEFTGGRVGCILAGPWTLSGYEDAGIDCSFNHLPKLGGKRSRPFVGILGFTISATSPNKKLAADFLENYLLTDEGLMAVNEDKPIGASALKSFQKMLGSDPVVAVTLENARSGDLMPSVPEMSRFWSSFQTALKTATTDRQSVDDALDTAARRIVKK
jgi:maltose/maltodextrin transport system substrate-binding protein